MQQNKTENCDENNFLQWKLNKTDAAETILGLIKFAKAQSDGDVIKKNLKRESSDTFIPDLMNKIVLLLFLICEASFMDLLPSNLQKKTFISSELKTE